MKLVQQLDENTIVVDGVKYQKVKQEPKSLYEIFCDYGYSNLTSDAVCDKVKNWLNDNRWNSDGEYFSGWNDCIEDLQQKIK